MTVRPKPLSKPDVKTVKDDLKILFLVKKEIFEKVYITATSRQIGILICNDYYAMDSKFDTDSDSKLQTA